MNLKIIAFDLDDTLIDTSSLLIPIAGTPEFEKRIQEPLPLLPGASENLEYLSKKYSLVLVTQGQKKFQQFKIESAQIKKYFSKIYIVDPKVENLNKKDLFRQCLLDFKISGSQALSIGNRRSTDIRLAKMNSYKTCLFQHGEHQDEKPEEPEDYPDFETHSHLNLIEICKL